MEQHLKILGILHIVNGAITIITGIFVLAMLALVGVAIEHSPGQHYIPQLNIAAGDLLIFFATGIGGLLILTGVPGIIGGWGLLAHKSWARMVVLIVGIIQLINFPFGTALGIYTIWVFVKTEPPVKHQTARQ